MTRDEVIQRPINEAYVPYFAHDGRYAFLYGGAGSGKSYGAAQKHIKRAATSPGERFLVARKVARTLRHSTFQLLRDVLAEWRVPAQVNRGDLGIRFPNGSEIIHTGLDDPEKLKSITGVTSAWVEEATELDQQDWDQINLRIRGDVPSYRQLTATFNPVPCEWLRKLTEDPPPGSLVLRTTHVDNAFIDATYAGVLAGLPEELRGIYERGEWSEIEIDPWAVIPSAWIRAAMERVPAPDRSYPISQLGVDPARGGRDQTVIAIRRGEVLEPLIVREGRTTPDGPAVAAEVLRYADRGTTVVVDVIGIGGAVYDALQANGIEAIAFNGSERSNATDRSGRLQFVNARAEAYWRMREALDPKHGADVVLPNDPDLFAELAAPRFKLTVRGIQIEKKDDIKDRLGRSPDRADAVTYAFAEVPVFAAII